ncbi:hypothetical protein GCM10010264_36770 [Streptomyces globisporus]|nr:hypothetical protein GCM10010264_36770 [Streptomyces globisporus]
MLRQAAVNSGSWKTRVKFAVPTHSGSEPGVYFWNAMITDRTAGYHENRMKQSSPPIRNPYAVAWSAIFLRSGRRGPRPAGRASPGGGVAPADRPLAGAAGWEVVFMAFSLGPGFRRSWTGRP